MTIQCVPGAENETRLSDLSDPLVVLFRPANDQLSLIENKIKGVSDVDNHDITSVLKRLEVKVEELEGQLMLERNERKAAIKKLESSNARLESSNARLESSNARLESSNARLESSNVWLESSNARLESSNARLESSNVRLESSDARLESSNLDLSKQLQHLSTTNCSLSSALQHQGNILHVLQRRMVLDDARLKLSSDYGFTLTELRPRPADIGSLVNQIREKLSEEDSVQLSKEAIAMIIDSSPYSIRDDGNKAAHSTSLSDRTDSVLEASLSETRRSLLLMIYSFAYDRNPDFDVL